MRDFQHGITRRGWLKTLGAAGAALAAGQILGDSEAAGQEPSAPPIGPGIYGP
jgi:hypothetical protein